MTGSIRGRQLNIEYTYSDGSRRALSGNLDATGTVSGTWTQGPVTGTWKMAKSSHEFVKKDAFTIEYRLTLPKESPGGKKTLVRLQYNRLNVQGNEPATF